MRVLALDLGITTGFAVREVGGSQELVATGRVVYDGKEIYDGDSVELALRQLVHRYLPSYVVVEEPLIMPQGQLAKDLTVVVDAYKRVFRTNVTKVTPSEWKPRFKSLPLPPSLRSISTHEKDAIRISEWWLKTSAPLANVDDHQ